MTFERLQRLVVDWADVRGIIQNSTPTAQLLKTVSELGELADSQIKNDEAAKVDAVGDVLVCLIIYCEMSGLNLVECLNFSYEEIKGRTGRMIPGGAFVKDE